MIMDLLDRVNPETDVKGLFQYGVKVIPFSLWYNTKLFVVSLELDIDFLSI